MYLPDVPVGSNVLLTLHSQHPAWPTREGSRVIHTTSKAVHRSRSDAPFTEGTGTVLENSNLRLTVQFVDRTNPRFFGVARLDYHAIQLLYVYQGETNEETVYGDLVNISAVPKMDIYRKKVILRWSE